MKKEDKIKEIFDDWATNGRADLMEREHSKTVMKFLNKISFEKPFSFLDFGCGNGWIVRHIANHPLCKSATGIDKSSEMIEEAKKRKKSPKENYFNKDILDWKTRKKFDYIFSMEALYYFIPMEIPLSKIYERLNEKGVFLCGTDYYSDNKATKRWAKQMNLDLDLRSISEWKKMFEKIGFKTKVKQVKDLNNRKKWKREFGTLFVTGNKM